MRATSVPIVELPPEKRTRIEGKFESFEGESPALAKIMQEVERMRDTVSRMGVVINRHHAVLLELCNAIENHGM